MSLSPLQSDLVVPSPLFMASAITPSSAQFDDALKAGMADFPKWHVVGIAKYREMWKNGEFSIKPVRLDCATNISIPSREPGRSIPCRLLRPRNSAVAKGCFMHIHGGGWAMGSHDDQDEWLQGISDTAGLVIISVGYRLAPEEPGPAGDEDCFDAAEWLVLEAKQQFGVELAFMGGESAGAHLTLLTIFHLLSHAQPEFHRFQLSGGLLLHFGCYDLGRTPSQIHHLRKEGNEEESVQQLAHLYRPGIGGEGWKNPSISPLYQDLEIFRKANGNDSRLPPALFTVGTKDFLLDDTVFMAVKWQMAGGDAIVRIFPGASHGYIAWPVDQVESARLGMQCLFEFIDLRLKKVIVHR